jgi:hypothetical protein
MARIDVTGSGNDTYRVEVHDKGESSIHDVTASPEVVRRYGGSASAEQLLEASFAFLLEREPKEAILARFDLPVIERYFPEYPREIRKRLG